MQVLRVTSTKVRKLVKKHTGLSANFPNAELGDKDPDLWWNTFEVNVRGVYNAVRFVLAILSLPRRDPNSGKEPPYRRWRILAGVSLSSPLMLLSSASHMQATMLLRNMPSVAWLNSSPLVRRHA